MRRAALWSSIAGIVAALAIAPVTAAGAQTCAIAVGGNVDLTASIDAAAGRLTIDSPAAIGGTLTAPEPVVLNATVEPNGVFAIENQFVLAADGVNLTWRVTSGALTVNEADQAGTFELAAELVESSDGTQRSGFLEITSNVTVVAVEQPTPLLITGTVSGSIECGPAATGSTPTTPTTAAPPSGGGAGDGTGVAVQDDDLAVTGLNPLLVVLGLLVVVAGTSGVVYGVGRVRFARWFPKSLPGDFAHRR